MSRTQSFELDHPQADSLPAKHDPFPPHLQLTSRSVVDAMIDALPEKDAKEEYAFRPVVPADHSTPVSRNVGVEQQDCWQCMKCGNYNSGRKSRCSACQGWNVGAQDSLAKSNDDQTEWECECGNLVGAKKTRCGSCQRWRGGKRNSWAGTGHHLSTTNEPIAREDWLCDSCGHSNGHNKVRCVACPRWRDGKRPNMKSTVPLQASDLASPDEATLAVVAAQGNWICHGCEAVNLGQKARCRICQSWKGGRRQNMPTRCSPAPTSDSQVPWACDGCGHTNGSVKLRCGSCQHWRDGRRLNMRTKHHNDLSTAPATSIHQQQKFPHLSNTPWQCAKCSQDNEATKLRCRTCKSWKNGKHKQQLVARALSPAPPLEPLATEAIAPWVCNGCNHMNSANKTRCDSCQCWKDHQSIQYGRINSQSSQINSRGYQSNHANHSEVGLSVENPSAMPAGYSKQSLEIQDGHDAKQQMTWMCPRCSKENLGTKARCGGCQKWKGQLERILICCIKEL
ncbi:hypothetical protein HJC23_005400 [Cyclotella cryptica]|uniref:RanBP2-type domain-containing protein n=1 Tax=Cyclotella cryptica TaxID=29204 RepID=A0ABD3P5U3_9STRA